MTEEGWIGVDLDGTLAIYDGWKGPEHIGEPIIPMLQRVKQWTKKGQEVRIFTARASDPAQIPPIKAWLKANGLPDLTVTCSKDFGMSVLYDDRCVQVLSNTGVTLESQLKEKEAELAMDKLTWTNKVPTEEGNYWVKVVGSNYSDLEYVEYPAERRWVDDAIFYGPIQEPTESEG